MPSVVLFLCGDVMTGRGVDQILPHPGAWPIHESYLHNARLYAALAEEVSGPIPAPVEWAYVWGDALPELERVAPQARILNLETSVTRSEDFWRGKEVNYRMHPDNVPCLTAARADVCCLANNHVLDYGRAGLRETLETLSNAGLRTAGAGRDLAEARRPAVVDLAERGRVLVFALGSETSGIPVEWGATERRAGVDLLADLSEQTAAEIEDRVRQVKRAGDVVVASIHWGSNWGYAVPDEQVWFAHRLIDGGVDVVHGHSSHHVRPVEVYRDRLVLYGCGDFINDYEGISGYEAYRDDLRLMYFPALTSEGALESLRLVPMQSRRLRLCRASADDARWLQQTINDASARFGVRVTVSDGDLFINEGLRRSGPASSSGSS